MEKISKYVIILIEEHRKKNNLTQEQISSMMEITQRYYQYLIANKHIPRFDTIYEMCEKIGLRLPFLILKAEQLKVESSGHENG